MGLRQPVRNAPGGVNEVLIALKVVNATPGRFLDVRAHQGTGRVKVGSFFSERVSNELTK